MYSFVLCTHCSIRKLKLMGNKKNQIKKIDINSIRDKKKTNIMKVIILRSLLRAKGKPAIITQARAQQRVQLFVNAYNSNT